MTVSAALDKYGRMIQLTVSTVNMLVLLGGLLWAMAIWYGDSNAGRRDADKMITAQASEITKLQARIALLEATDQTTIGMVRDGQDKTSNRLTALETQNTFILKGLDELKSALAGMKRTL
jgi:uncharacterized coiled-coil protein SlyX